MINTTPIKKHNLCFQKIYWKSRLSIFFFEKIAAELVNFLQNFLKPTKSVHIVYLMVRESNKKVSQFLTKNYRVYFSAYFLKIGI